jgi:xanthine dehydrogenase accessory factor
MRELLATLAGALDARRDCVLCSVVETRGSTPQKAGAAMLVFVDGSQAGTLGGGCVEAEVKRQALRALAGDAGGSPQLFTFCLDDNYGWDDGLICGGRMSILAWPLSASPSSVARGPSSKTQDSHGPVFDHGQRTTDSGPTHYFRRLRGLVDAGCGCTEAVAVHAEHAGVPLGSRYLFDAAGSLIEQVGPLPPDAIRTGLVPLAKRPMAWQARGVAYLPVLPRITLLIVGGGHVGQAVGKLAADVDFDIWVLDDRAAYASSERFPAALRRLVGDVGAELQALRGDITPSVYAMIVTRGHAHDEEALYHLATSAAGYVGMIGSKRKIKLIYEDLIARGVPREALDRVHAPLGLAIGSQTVPEIAVSIVAELIAHRNLGASIPAARIKVPV